MKKQLTALVLCICMVLSVLPFSSTQAAAEETSSVGTSNISIGDYIRLGNYNGQPILWRCVDVDEMGPLMLSDQVLATMAYDAKTSENSATRSHSRNLKRGTYGSNQWRDSNMRSWLNSKAEAGKVEWLCGNPPKSGFVGENPYDQAAGFLNGFKEDEIAAIKTVTQRSIVSHPEYNAGMIEGQGADLPYDTNIEAAANGFDQAYYENVTDKVFLMDVKQINKVYQNNSQLGDSYHIAYKGGVRWPYWLRTPVTDCNHDMRYVETDGRIDRNAPYLGFYGVRPAFYLDTQYYQVTGGDGTADSPYRGAAVNKPEENFTVSGDGPTPGQEWDVSLDKSIQLYLGPNYSKSKKYESATIPIQVIQKTRSDNENMVVVICGEGYTKGEQQKFVAAAKRLWEGAMQYEPYKTYKDRFNVYALCTASDKTYSAIDGYDSTFFDVWGKNISVNGSQWKNHIFERCIGPAFIEKVHDAHIPQQADPNVDWDFEKYKYVHDYISQFVLLVNSANDFGGAFNDLDYGFHYIVSPAYSQRAVETLTHELGHGLLWLGDEYNSGSFMGEASEKTSLNRTGISDPEQVKWRQLLGFRKTYSVPHTDYDTDKIYNSSRECMMRQTWNGFCEVCKLQGNKRMRQLVTEGPDLYVAEPEVTKRTDAYTKLSDFSDATGWGYTKFDADKKTRLLTGADKITFQPTEMKGQKIELRTIVQNLSDTKLSQVTLQVWVNHADGTIATADGQPVAASETFKIPLWTEKGNFRPKGTLEYHGSDFNSGLKNCSLLYTIPSNADLRTGDTVGYAVRDEQGTVLAYEGTLPNKGQDILPAPEPAKSYTVTFCYNDGRENTTKTTGINGKLGDLPAPAREGYVFDGWYTTGGEKVDLTRVYSSNTVLYARWSEYIAPSPNVKKAPVILLATSPDTVTEGEQVMLSVSETSGFGVDLSGVTYTADPSLPISGTGEAQTIRLDQAGTYTFTAHYSGDNEKYLAADSNRVTVTVTKKADVSGGTTSGGGSSAGGGSSSGGGAAAGGATAGGGAANGNASATTTPDIKDSDGTTVAIVNGKKGMITAEVQLSEKAIANAEKSGEAVKLPVEVKAGKNIKAASTVTINLPEGAGKTKVKIPVKNMTVGTVAVLVNADGTEKIVKKSVAAKDGVQLIVDEDTTVKLVDKAKNFKDTKKHWAKDSIDFVSARGLMNGKSSTAFAPEAKITRARLWTILARWEDVDLTGGKKWYSKARAWAKNQGISDGSRPNAAITRAEAITMLWRAQGKPAAEQETAFKDVSSDEYYAQAVAWAKEKGIAQANSKGRFNPDAACTRAEIAAFLYRMSLSE